MICEQRTSRIEAKKNAVWNHCARIVRERTPDSLDIVDRFPEVDHVLDDLFKKDKLRCA